MQNEVAEPRGVSNRNTEQERRGTAADRRDTVRLYGRYIGISVRGQMQYRASFLMTAFGNLLATGLEFLGIWALFARFGSLRGWTLPEVALFYGIVNLAFACAEAAARGFDLFPNQVKNGDFDRLLLRPRGTAFQVAAQELQLMRVGRLLQGLAVSAWAVSALHIDWTAAKITLVIAAIFGGACLFIGLFILQATLAFWTVESLEIMNTVTYGGTETGQLPMTIYRPWFRRFFTFVIPLACMNYIPMSVVLPHRELAGGPALLPWLAPAAGVIFLLVSLRLWNVGVRHYVSTGS